MTAAVFLGCYFRHAQVQKSRGVATMELPRFIVVETDCLLRIAKRGEFCQSAESLRSLMAGLVCRGPWPAAWKMLLWLAGDSIAVLDYFAVAGMEGLASKVVGEVIFLWCVASHQRQAWGSDFNLRMTYRSVRV
ncbi:hypothetical protein P153DRAFT_401953 [Dothidotthia symphoricarpi CBS 119687]|uniref:Uncharacterized protein n=1 Tax=Dothidotthia symphoricarpi CBS 119687 TaxID=1392245 RepID=A0A6A5ZWS4_9PLEO|nr:uncharacterized protein P153DRAFT_401953 [Dothidotthia symphoricarpi CBS 119687]KAF2123475.1 hypothetical protein P153DRAFT_401953 [Dothidotthia symphoricarpi CBS 119687]